MERLIFHVDVNSAFLSWEASKRVAMGEDDLRLIPSVIGGDPSRRSSIVTAKSIPAKAYGINTGEPVSMALRKCPNLVVVPGDFKLYSRCSHSFKEICRMYGPVVESFSIDEVFMDMTGTSLIYPDPIATAHEIKNKIRDELGFTVNVGIGRNKLCAKMASDFEKPDKVHTLFPEEIADKMWPLPVGELFSCGKSSSAHLMSVGIKTIGDLAQADDMLLEGILGSAGAARLKNCANGIDDSPVSDKKEDAKGYSIETTLEDDLTDIEEVRRLLLSQADIVAGRLRSDDARCACVAVTLRDSSFKNRSHQTTLDHSTDLTDEIFNVAFNLFMQTWDKRPLRLIGISLTHIDRSGFEQIGLFDTSEKEKRRKLDQALDQIRGRYGNKSIYRASTAGTKRNKKYD